MVEHLSMKMKSTIFFTICCPSSFVLFSWFIISFLHFAVSDDFCATCNCCIPAAAQNYGSPEAQNKVPSNFPEAGSLFVQNDAHSPPNPKPLVLESPKFYKINYKTIDEKNSVSAKIPLNTMLQGIETENMASQAILYPMPVAFIVQPIIQKCSCKVGELTTKTPNDSCIQKENGNRCPKCDKCVEREEKSVEGKEEGEEEKALDDEADKGGDGCREEGGEACQSKEEQDKLSKEAEEEEPERQSGNKCQNCVDCGIQKQKGEKAKESNEFQEGQYSSTSLPSPLEQQQNYHQEQKIPIEVFKKFVAKSTGFVPPIPLPDASDRPPHEDSFENLKERLKEISNKMDLLKNLSIEMKGFRQFPRFGNFGRTMGNGWPNYGYGSRLTDRGQEGRIGQMQEPSIPSLTAPPLLQNPYIQSRMQFLPKFTNSPPTTTVQFTHNQKTEEMDSANESKSTLTTTSPLAKTTMNHQAFLLNAIEEFLRESQKIRKMATAGMAKAMHISDTTTMMSMRGSNIVEIVNKPITPVAIPPRLENMSSILPITTTTTATITNLTSTSTILASTTIPISNTTVTTELLPSAPMTTTPFPMTTSEISPNVNFTINPVETMENYTAAKENASIFHTVSLLTPPPYQASSSTPMEGELSNRNVTDETVEEKMEVQQILSTSTESFEQPTIISKGIIIPNQTAIQNDQQSMADQSQIENYDPQQEVHYLMTKNVNGYEQETMVSDKEEIVLGGNLTRSATAKEEQKEVFPTRNNRLISLITSLDPQDGSIEKSYLEENGSEKEKLPKRHIKDDENEGEEEESIWPNNMSYDHHGFAFSLLLALFQIIFFNLC